MFGIKQQNLPANDAFHYKLEWHTVETLERPIKPGFAHKVMNSSDDTCSFPFRFAMSLKTEPELEAFLKI